MEGIELICFQIISTVGNARSCYIEAINMAKMRNFSRAQELIETGNLSFNEGHMIHTELIQQEANGKKCDTSLLLIHAEDQLMSAETFKILAEEFIQLYKMIN